MAIKKNELYSSLWASCDKLRGGMDASQYKDYILTLLFVKYVTDKFKGVKYADLTVPEGGGFDDMIALKGHKNIGEGLDVIIARLAEAFISSKRASPSASARISFFTSARMSSTTLLILRTPSLVCLK